MTQMETPTTATAGVTSHRVTMVVRTLIAGGALPKLSGSEVMVTMFNDIGGGDLMRIFVGAAELASRRPGRRRRRGTASTRASPARWLCDVR